MISILGHYGSGKTLLASEAVKMKLARLKAISKKVDVYILTFNGNLSYKLLMEDLKYKWFGDQNVIIRHFTDFLQRFTEEYKEHLNPKQLEDLYGPKLRGTYRHGGKHFKIVLTTICQIMKEFNKTSIIMLDEVPLRLASKRTTKNGKTSFDVDFSYLANYDNVHFVICIRPSGTRTKNFSLIFPSNENGQFYQLLHNRHRSSINILRFLTFYQLNLPKEFDSGYLGIDFKEILDEASLPPTLDPPGYGVIWIPSGVGAQEENIALDKVIEILATLQGEPSVSILYTFEDSKRMADSLFTSNDAVSWNSNQPNIVTQVATCLHALIVGKWNGPHHMATFNGAESSVIIFFCDGYLEIQSMARARQLLVIVTCGEKSWNDSLNYMKHVKPMNEAVKKNLVRKMGDTKFTKISPPSTDQTSELDNSFETPSTTIVEVTRTNQKVDASNCLFLFCLFLFIILIITIIYGFSAGHLPYQPI